MEARERDGQRDFDFWFGSWKVNNRRLRERLKGSTTWDEFDGTVVVRPVWGGKANVDEYQAMSPLGLIQGMSIRLYDLYLTRSGRSSSRRYLQQLSR